MDPAVPWQYTYNRLAQGAATGDLHHHFAQAANNTALSGGHSSSVGGVPSTTSQLLLQAAHSNPLGASTASAFPTPSSFLSAPSYDVFSPLFHHANPKPAHFNTINVAAQHRQQVLAAQAAVTKQTADSDIIRENYTQHHPSISTPQTGSYFEQSSGSAVAAALGWQARGQPDFTTLRSQGDLNSNNQLPSAFGILPHESVSSSAAAPSASKHSSGSSSGAYESFNAHFPQPLNQANALIKSSSTGRSLSPHQAQQQTKQQTIAPTSAPSTSAYYQTPSSSTYQNMQSSFANSKSISQQDQLHHQASQHSNYNNNSNQAISGSKSSFSSSTGIGSSSQLTSSSVPSASMKAFSNSPHHISSRVKSERSNSPVISSHSFASSTPLHKIASMNPIHTKAALKAIVTNPSADKSLAQGHGQSQASAMPNNDVIHSSPNSFSILENQVTYNGSNNNSSHSASNTSRKISTPMVKHAQPFQQDSASSIPNSHTLTNYNQKHQTSVDYSHIVIPRRPSPHQISSQSSPLGTVPSPAYPTYNSPMNHSQSPIDASVSRSSSKPNQVAYSSVIQRTALPSNWDDQANIYNHPSAQVTKLHQTSPVQLVHSQPSGHFDGSQSGPQHHNAGTLNAQKLGESIQQVPGAMRTDYALNQQNMSKSDEPKSRPGRKKKINDQINSDKLVSPSTCSEYYPNDRVPPPAHLPNQHGSPNSNFNGIHSHNSATIAHPSHHHTISHPYFSSFPMPLASSDYSNDSNVNSASMVANNPYNDSLGTPSVSSNYSPTASEIREDEPPKVVVPNIEEELGFLAENNRNGSIAAAQLQSQQSAQNHLTLLGATNNAISHHNQSSHQPTHPQHSSHTNQSAHNSQLNSPNQTSQQKAPLTDKKFPTPTGPGSGFMASYLKFLQGERDSSPPPVNRGSGGGRKTWSRSTNQQTATQVSPAPCNAMSKNQVSNGGMHNNMMYDRKRAADDDDDNSDSSSSKQPPSRNRKQSQQSVVERAPQVPINVTKKARTTQSNHMLSSQQPSNVSSLPQSNPHTLPQNPQLLVQQHANTAHQLVADPLPQRRETSHRKAKGRKVLNTTQKQGLDQGDELDDFVDSDSDPAWTPQKGDEDEDDVPRRKSARKSRNTNKTSSKINDTKLYATPAQQSSGAEQKANTVVERLNTGALNSQCPDGIQVGDFIVSRQDVFLEWPSIWRVDSKTLLQKYEPFSNNSKMIYRSLSTYAQWTPENRRSYVLVKCKLVGQLQHELHVELLRSELCSDTAQMYIEKVMQEALAYQDQFEVYIQTLISQALDSNFLTEIMQEQDDYFISNVKTIDDLSTERKLRLRNCTPWAARLLYSIETWPCYNTINDLGVTNNGQIICAACNKRNIVARVILFGQPYNPNTIGAIQLENRFSFDKDFLLCRGCMTRCELFHKIAHQKYLMFMQCSKKVAEKNGEDPNKGTTVILNELLADEAWLAQIFENVRRLWADVDQIERQHRLSL